jgi:hypothetical protein
MHSPKHILLLAFVGTVLLVPVRTIAQKRLATNADYHSYIDSLLEVKDFGTHYVEDGAADASVLFPTERTPIFHLDRPSDEVIVLVQLGNKSIPLLIDCLGDGRLTTVRFNGNMTTKFMNVPVGYVCLDILSTIVKGAPVSERECGFDGLGACMSNGFYFRPDDYWDCLENIGRCKVRPWIAVVQRNWKREFLQKRLRFRNPYGGVSPLSEYKEFAMPKK